MMKVHPYLMFHVRNFVSYKCKCVFFKINLNNFTKIGCESSNPSWIGDGYCDDETNNAGCHFDGGDCCGSNINTEWCAECNCLE